MRFVFDKRTVILLIVCLIALSGCVAAPGSLGAMETTVYSDSHGYRLKVPTDWFLSQDAEQSNIVTFNSPDNQISLQIVTELGGYGFNNVAELGAQVFDTLSESLEGLVAETDLPVRNARKQYRQQLSFDGEDARMVIDNYIYAPFPSVNLHLFFIVAAEDYADRQALFSDIIRSLEIYLSVDEIYVQIEQNA